MALHTWLDLDLQTTTDHIVNRTRSDLALDALEMALWARGKNADGLVHHSDRGSQYLSIRYTERLAEAGAVASVGSKGDSYDNALAETIIGFYKTEGGRFVHSVHHYHLRAPWSHIPKSGYYREAGIYRFLFTEPSQDPIDNKERNQGMIPIENRSCPASAPGSWRSGRTGR